MVAINSVIREAKERNVRTINSLANTLLIGIALFLIASPLGQLSPEKTARSSSPAINQVPGNFTL